MMLSKLDSTIPSQWIIAQVTSNLDSGLTGLGKNDGKSASVLIMSLYKAQATQYQRAIQLVVGCETLPSGSRQGQDSR
jgi:hypothetical protein